MSKYKNINPKGFTLVELMVAITLVSIVIFGVGMLIVDGQRGWQTMYGRINADVITDGYVARKMFDTVARKASAKKILLDEDLAGWIELYYYDDPNSAAVDRYARFYYISDEGEVTGQLNVEYGYWDPNQSDPRTPERNSVVCENVTDCTFQNTGKSVQMLLTLDDGRQTVTVASSDVMQNR